MSNVQEPALAGPWNVSVLAGPLPNLTANQLTVGANLSVGNLYSVAPAADLTLYVPDATAPQNVGGMLIVVTNTANSNTVTLAPAIAGQLLAGASTIVLSNTALDAIALVSDGSNWYALAKVAT